MDATAYHFENSNEIERVDLFVKAFCFFLLLLFVLLLLLLSFFTKFSSMAPELPLLWRRCKQEV